MRTPPLPADEPQRLEALRHYRLLDTAPEPAFDELTSLAARVCETPIALITLIDADRQWFKAKVGLAVDETPRDLAFCAHTILQRELFLVPDTTQDERFANNPFVTGAPHIRFYAGAPLLTPEGQAIGSLSVIDCRPRELSPLQLETLQVLSRQVMAQLELRRQAGDLAENDARLQLALAAAHMGSFEWDVPQGRIAWSRGYERVWGFAPGESGGTYEEFARRVHPDDLPGVDAEMARCIAQHQPFNWDFRVIWPDGSIHWLQARGEFTFTRDGKPERMRGVVTEATRRKRTEEQLRWSEGRLRRIMESDMLGLLFWTTAGEITDANDAFLRLVGYAREDVASGRVRWREMTPPEHSAADERSLRELATTGTCTPFEKEYVRKDGSRIPVLIGGAVFPEQPDHGVAFVLDLTERKRAESRLREREEQLRLFVEHSPAAVAMFDRQMRYLVASRRWMDDFRLVPQSVLGRSHYEVFPELPQRWIEVHRRCLAGAVEACAEDPFLRGDGRTDWIRWEVRPWRQADSAIGGIIIFAEVITDRKHAEEAVRESEQRLRKVIDGLGPNNFVGLLATDGTLLEANQPALAAAGLKLADVVGKPVDQTYWFAYSAPVQEQLRAAVARASAGEASRYDVQIRVAEGSLLWLDFSIEPVRDAAGRVTHLVPSATVVEARKQAEQHIQQLNRVYAVLSDINQTIVRERDPRAVLAAACRIAVEKGQFCMAWIGQLEAATGRLEITAHAGAAADTLRILETLVGGAQLSCDFTALALHDGAHGVCNDIARDPRAAPWREAALQRGYRALASLPLKAGERVIGTFNLYAGTAGFFDAEELRLLDELALDLSFALEVCRREVERRKTEEELRWRTAFFEAQADSALDGILIVDSQRRRILQNQRMNDLWKIPPAVAGNPDIAVQIRFVAARTKDPEQFAEKVSHLYDHPAETSRDVIELVDGMVLDRSSYPVRDKAGAHFGRIWIFRDISEQRRLEEKLRQSQKMEAIGRLAGGVAHDFNNLLTVINGYGTLLLTPGEIPGGTIDAAQQIVHAAERAANLTRQLLVFSRRQIMQPRQLDLNESVTGLVKMLQRIVGEDVHLQLNLHPGPLLTRADPGMLDQVLLNLVVNARDAMPAGGRLIIATEERTFTNDEAAAIPEASPGRHVCVRVSDTGSGIAPEHLPHLFEPFFTTKEPGKGTGLGLATVFGIARQHGGTVAVESELGRGATFKVFLPAAKTAEPAARAAPAETKPRGGSETVLLVEDDPTVRQLTRIVLERAGYRVLEATDGVKALELAAQDRAGIQLLFTDIVMPEGINGLELASRLQAVQPALRVLFSSGYSADIAGRELSLQEGQNFIQKPASPRQLLQTVRRCLDA